MINYIYFPQIRLQIQRLVRFLMCDGRAWSCSVGIVVVSYISLLADRI